MGVSRSREEIIAAHKGGTQKLEAVASRLSQQDPEGTVYPGWTVRDVLCHLAAGSGAVTHMDDLENALRA
jgi:hypothetical protein